MSNLLCLSEIEKPHIYHSPLLMKCEHKVIDTYCTLTESHFIIFKKKTDVVSYKQIPMSDKTKIDFQYGHNQFSISIGNFIFTFSNQDVTIVKSWINEMSTIIQNLKVIEPMKNFYHTEVKIDQLPNSNHEVYILIGYEDYKLYIFESLDHHHHDIAMHVINLKYYKTKDSPKIHRSSNPLRGVLKSFKLIGANIQFKFSFKDEESMSKWRTIVDNATSNSIINNSVGVLPQIYENESNMFCADCGYANPQWVSINLCITVCINCAGLHRAIGTSYSRIQSAIIDERIWQDCHLVKLIQQIGNKRSNSFWLKQQPTEENRYSRSSQNPDFIRDKYVKKSFIDGEFCNLTEPELKSRLKESVSSEDVFLTLRLWQSIDFQCDRTFVDELSEIARDCQQLLQQRFLCLQPQSSTDAVAEYVGHIAVNSTDKLDNLFLVSLHQNCISIKRESSHLSSNDMVDVCCVYLYDVTIVYYDVIGDSLHISIAAPIAFANTTVDRFTMFNEARLILRKFHRELMRALVPHDFVKLTDDSNLFINVDVKLNAAANATRCKCYLADHELIFDRPISMIYNLKKSSVEQQLISTDNGGHGDRCGVVVKLANSQLELMPTRLADQQIIYHCLQAAAKSMKLLSTEDESFPMAIDKMIAFISYRGLLSEGIFRIAGTTKKINNLFNSIDQLNSNFSIDPTIYDVNDVASCLKKYFRSLEEPLIPVDLFPQFLDASEQQQQTQKIDLYVKAMVHLPTANYQIFRRILELFLMIRLNGNINKMDSDSLAISTASSFISFDMANALTNATIMRDLIDNFQTLFDYSDKECHIIHKFVKNPEPASKSTMRTFYVGPSLLRAVKIVAVGNERLSFLHRDNPCTMVHVNMDQCRSVQQLRGKIFVDAGAELWHFLTNESGFFHETWKRVVYVNEDIYRSIVYPHTSPDHRNSYFVFLASPHIDDGVSRTERRLFQCNIKMKSPLGGRACSLMLSFPDSLQLFDNDNESQSATFDFSLADLSVYQLHHEKNAKKLLVMHVSVGVCQFKFATGEELRDFLFFYDQFRRKSSSGV